jgi:hypothetical protein
MLTCKVHWTLHIAPHCQHHLKRECTVAQDSGFDLRVKLGRVAEPVPCLCLHTVDGYRATIASPCHSSMQVPCKVYFLLYLVPFKSKYSATRIWLKETPTTGASHCTRSCLLSASQNFHVHLQDIQGSHGAPSSWQWPAQHVAAQVPAGGHNIRRTSMPVKINVHCLSQRPTHATCAAPKLLCTRGTTFTSTTSYALGTPMCAVIDALGCCLELVHTDIHTFKESMWSYMQGSQVVNVAAPDQHVMLES